MRIRATLRSAACSRWLVLKLVVMFVILVHPTRRSRYCRSASRRSCACLRYYSRRMTDRAEQVKARESGLIERAHEILVSVRAVKSFARGGGELAKCKGW